MFKKTLYAVIAGLAFLCHGGTARAQFLDMSPMVQNELNFQRQFDNWAWQGSLQVARQLRLSGQPNPFNAITISNSIREGQDAFTGYIHNSQLNSDRMSRAVGNWTIGAIRAEGGYVDPSTGNVYNLPWTHSVYHIDPYGYAVPGYNPDRVNLYPHYGR